MYFVRNEMLAECLLSFRFASDIEGCLCFVGKRDVVNGIQLCLHETLLRFREKIATLLLADT